MNCKGLLISAGLVLMAGCLGGCLERTISITTEPEGAIVWVNDVEVGRTPLESDFTFYGTFDVRIRKEGYEPIVTHAKANPPIQELPPVDLAAEAIPVTFNHVVHWHWVLTPVAETAPNAGETEQSLIQRARDLRGETAENQPLVKKDDVRPEAGPGKSAPAK